MTSRNISSAGILENLKCLEIWYVFQVDELCDHLAAMEEAESLVLRNTSGTDESIAKISMSLKQSSADLKAS